MWVRGRMVKGNEDILYSAEHRGELIDYVCYWGYHIPDDIERRIVINKMGMSEQGNGVVLPG